METPLDISYLSDAVLMLRYFELSGTVRSALSVVKKRSGNHEHTIREFRLTGASITLGPPLYVRLSVIDTGAGMGPEILSRVFEPFFTTKDGGKGSGLGLAQVHGFATQSQGTVRIKSELGKLTIIELYMHRPSHLPSEARHLIDLNR